MKHWINAVALICFCSTAQAAYFRLVDPAHPNVVVGALVDPLNLSQTSAASLVPIVTHSPKDGCFLTSIVCEDWTPFAAGASMNAGKVTFDVAPLANVLPWFQSAALALAPSKWTGLVNILRPSTDGSVTFSAGPVWEYRQRENKGYFKIFTGLSLNF